MRVGLVFFALLLALTPVASAQDRDADCVSDAVDCCPGVFNPRQEDCNGDGTCDACQAGDHDTDGLANDRDNCACVRNTFQFDEDGDARNRRAAKRNVPKA